MLGHLIKTTIQDKPTWIMAEIGISSAFCAGILAHYLYPQAIDIAIWATLFGVFLTVYRIGQSKWRQLAALSRHSVASLFAITLTTLATLYRVHISFCANFQPSTYLTSVMDKPDISN